MFLVTKKLQQPVAALLWRHINYLITNFGDYENAILYYFDLFGSVNLKSVIALYKVP